MKVRCCCFAANALQAIIVLYVCAAAFPWFQCSFLVLLYWLLALRLLRVHDRLQGESEAVAVHAGTAFCVTDAIRDCQEACCPQLHNPEVTVCVSDPGCCFLQAQCRLQHICCACQSTVLCNFSNQCCTDCCKLFKDGLSLHHGAGSPRPAQQQPAHSVCQVAGSRFLP